MRENSEVRERIRDLVATLNRSSKAPGSNGGGGVLGAAARLLGNGNGNGNGHAAPSAATGVDAAELLGLCREQAMRVVLPAALRKDLAAAMKAAGERRPCREPLIAPPLLPCAGGPPICFPLGARDAHARVQGAAHASLPPQLECGRRGVTW